MADPTPYKRSYSFTNYQADTPDRPLPGNRVDVELDNIAENSRILTETVNAGFKVDANLEDIVKVGDEIERVVFVAQNMPDVRAAAGVAPYVQQAIALFLGAFPEDPTEGTNGDPLTIGATYYNTVISQSFVWTGSAWVPVAQVSVGGVLQGSLIVADGETTFTIGDYVSVTVARNGRVLRPGIDYTTASPDITVPLASNDDEITWFGILKGSITDAAAFVRQTILTTTATRYSTNTDGQPLNLTPSNHILFGASPFAVLTYGVDYTVDAGDLVFSFTPTSGELYHVFSMPRFTNTEAQVILQDLEERVSADADRAEAAAQSITRRDQATYFLSDYLHPTDLAAAVAGNTAGQDAARVTTAVQQMHDDFMEWWVAASGRVGRLEYPAGTLAVNDEMFSETFAQALYAMGSARSRNRVYMNFDGTVFDVSGWTQRAAVRTSGFFLDKGITYPVPKVVFRWMQSGGFAFCPAISGTMTIRGGGSVANDPVGVLLSKISKPKINNIRVSGLYNHQFMLEEAYNGDISELDLFYGGYQPTEYGGEEGHLSSTVRFSNVGAVVTATEATFNASHVGKFFCLAQAGATDQGIRLNFWATIASVDSATQITLSSAPDTNVTGQTASFEAMRVSGTAGSNVLTMSAALSANMAGRYVTIMRARTAGTSTDTATLTTVITAHTGDQITVAHAPDANLSGALLVFSPQLWMDAHPENTGPSRSDNINFPDLRAESTAWHTVASVPALVGKASLIDFSGAKLHGAANTHNNFGGSATILAMGRATQLSYDGALTHVGQSPRWGGVMAVGPVSSAMEGAVTSYGDSTHTALFYVSPRDPAQTISIFTGLSYPSTQFPRLSQTALRLGPNGASDMVSAIGSARRVAGGSRLFTTRVGAMDATSYGGAGVTTGQTGGSVGGGQLMAVGFGGNTGNAQPALSTDLNNENGQHKCVRAETGTANRPGDAQTWLVHCSINSGITFQTAQRVTFGSTPVVVCRHNNNTGGAWSAWCYPDGTSFA